MIKNVVFDLGGVVVNCDARNWLVDRFFNKKMEDTLYALTFGSENWQRWDRGEIGYNTLCRLVLEEARQKGVAFETGVVLEDWFAMLTNKNGTIDLMVQLKKAGYKLYFLSNTEVETIEKLSRRPFWRLWDGGVTSYEVGVCKPAPDMYAAIVSRYGLIPTETIFIDDKRENVEMAMAMGMTGLRYISYRTLLNDLQSHGLPVHSRSLLRRSPKEAKKAAEEAPKAAMAEIAPQAAPEAEQPATDAAEKTE